MKIKDLLANFKHNIESDIDDRGPDGELTVADFAHIQDVVNRCIIRAVEDLPTKSATKILIVDLYGDHKTIRVMEDTPAAEAAVWEFDKADRAYARNTKTDPPQFEEFLHERGIQLMETRQISIGD